MIFLLCFQSAVKGALSGLRKFFATESVLKVMKNAFYFILKSLFVLKIFKFFSRHFGHVEKRPDLKDKVNSKFMTSKTEKETIAMNTLSIISRNKGNHMKFG